MEERQLLKEFLGGLVENERTLLNYESALYNLCKKMNVKHMLRFVVHADTANEIIEFVYSTMANDNSKVKTLSALLKVSGNDAYRSHIQALNTKNYEAYKEQKQSPQREQQAKSIAHIKAMHDELLGRFVDWDLSSVDNDKKIALATDVLITGLMTGVYAACPPRRLQDYFEMLLHEEDASKNHFCENRTKMRFNIHKMSERYTEPREPVEFNVPSELIAVIEFLANIRPKRMYLLMNSVGKQYQSSQLSHRLKKLLGFSCDVIRSVYLSEKYEDVPAYKEMADTALAMGHSVNTALTCYVKRL